MSSTSGSNKQSREPVRRAAVITHGKVETIGPALERLAGIAGTAGVELIFPEEEREKHGMPGDGEDPTDVHLAVVLGGD